MSVTVTCLCTTLTIIGLELHVLVNMKFQKAKEVIVSQWNVVTVSFFLCIGWPRKVTNDYSALWERPQSKYQAWGSQRKEKESQGDLFVSTITYCMMA